MGVNAMVAWLFRDSPPSTGNVMFHEGAFTSGA